SRCARVSPPTSPSPSPSPPSPAWAAACCASQPGSRARRHGRVRVRGVSGVLPRRTPGMTAMRRGQDPNDQIDAAQGAKLARYVAGRSSPEEAAEVRAWVAADPQRAEILEALEQVWRLARETEAVWDVDAAWQEVRRRREASRFRPRLAQTGARRSSGAGFLRAAAIAAIVLGGAAVWALVDRESARWPREVVMHEYTTGRAQRARGRLRDGTSVVLSADSRLRVPQDYGRRSRDVHLEGEARFDVQHDGRRPFRVPARGVVAEDLGTVFGVRAYPETPAVTVV